MESVLRGPAPLYSLERTFNPHLCGSPFHSLLPGMRTFDAETGHFLTGLLPDLKRGLRELGVRYRVIDPRGATRATERWRLDPALRLRDYQHRIVEEASSRPMGLIEAGTGAGKTIIAAALIARLGVRTIWLTTTRVLLAQARDDLARLLGVEPGVIGAGERRPAPLTVALVQAVARRPDLVRNGYQMMIFDEGHHGAAPTFARAVRAIDARRNYYLSAVPERSGEDQVVLSSITGGVVASAPARTLIEEAWLCPVEPRWEEIRIAGKMTELQFPTVYRRFICENEGRNARVADIADDLSRSGETVLVLVERIRHGRLLMERLGERARFVSGRTARRALAAAVSAFSRREPGLLIATSGLFAEGVNIENISAIVWAGGLKSRVKTLQAVGRGMRPSPGKTRCLYMDFVDRDDLGLLLKHSRARMKTLEEAGLNGGGGEDIPGGGTT